MGSATVLEKGGGRLEEQGLLFEYTVKLLLLVGFLELVLYRLISRLGMHLSKVAEKHEFVRATFKLLSSVGFTLLNFTALLVFLAIFLLLFQKIRTGESGRYDMLLVPSASLLVILTVAFLVFPPAMLGSVAYNTIAVVVLAVLGLQYVVAIQSWGRRVMIVCYLLGVTGWLYYQTVSTAYGLLGLTGVPPLAHEINRAGEALMVLASILVFWAYGTPPFRTKNKRQRQRLILLGVVGVSAFVGLLFLDYFLVLYDRDLAENIRKAGEGIGWIFQMGMGYTFYLPFALYVTGLLCWAYTVVKLVAMGRVAGFGLALMFFAGYALQLSHLTLMVVLGLMLLNLDRRRAPVPASQRVGEAPVSPTPTPILGGQM